ncbi:MAG: DJ-1/PfpI family protein [Bacteroidota bacterium]
MKLGYLLFDRITWLDFIGVYDPLTRLKSMGFLPDLSWETCAFELPVRDSFGLAMVPDKIGEPLHDYDVLIVPGGFGTRDLIQREDFMDWVKTAGPVPLKASICTGSLILGAAGFLQGKRATTHFDEYAALTPMCGEVVKARIVEDDGLITAGAVATSLDLGLHLVEKWAGTKAREQIRQRMDYPA